MAKKVGGAKKPAKQRAAKSDSLRMLIVEARFYKEISDKLLAGAISVLDEAGATHDRITVPGALEISAAIVMAADAAKAKHQPYDGVVALGCVILGETYHFEVVSNESARGLTELALRERLAIGNGILTVDTEAQAHARLGGDHGHKGAEAARAALTMAGLKRTLAGR